MAKQKVPAPDGLGTGGTVLWVKIVTVYDLRADELATLEDACRITDMIDSLDSAWAKDGRPMTAVGSMAQMIIHPLIGEMRTQRMARNALWRQLKLPDAAGAEAGGSGEPNQHRAAANSKWAAAHGKGA